MAGCVIFGVGVVVGAFLGPLAKPKTTPSPPPPAPAQASGPPSKTSASRGASHEQTPAKTEQLTFFQTLKEGSTQAGQGFVPFKPTGEAPPPLEALIPKEPGRGAGQASPSSPEGGGPGGLKDQRRYYVLVAAFQYKENARRLIQELRQRGYTVVAMTVRGGRQAHQVRVGPFGSRAEAAAVGRRLRAGLLYPTSVFREAAPEGR